MSAIYILDKITEYYMRSRRSSKKELAEALAAIAVILSFELAAPALALALGTLTVGDLIAIATFSATENIAANFGAGVAFYTYVGGCGYTFYSTAVQAWHQGWAALNNEQFWVCTAITAGIL